MRTRDNRAKALVLTLLSFPLFGIVDFFWKGWQDRAIAATVEFNKWCRDTSAQQSGDYGAFSDARLRIREAVGVRFSGTTVTPFSAWGIVEVRFMLRTERGDETFEVTKWDVRKPKPVLLEVTFRVAGQA